MSQSVSHNASSPPPHAHQRGITTHRRTWSRPDSSSGTPYCGQHPHTQLHPTPPLPAPSFSPAPLHSYHENPQQQRGKRGQAAWGRGEGEGAPGWRCAAHRWTRRPSHAQGEDTASHDGDAGGGHGAGSGMRDVGARAVGGVASRTITPGLGAGHGTPPPEITRWFLAATDKNGAQKT